MFEAEYKKKLRTAEEAVQLIPSRGNLSMGMGVSEPPAVLAALEQRILRHEIENLRIYYSHSVAAASAILKYEYMDVIKPHPFFPVAAERELARKGALEGRKVVYYMPGNFSKMPRVLADIGMDAFIVMVAPMDKGGFFSCGTNGDYTIPTAQSARKLIVEVNPHMPRVFGDSAVHISDVDAIVEHESALAQFPARPPGEFDVAISKLIVEMVPDRAMPANRRRRSSQCDLRRAHQPQGPRSAYRADDAAAGRADQIGRGHQSLQDHQQVQERLHSRARR